MLQLDRRRVRSEAKADTKMHLERLLYVGGVSAEFKHKVGSVSWSYDAYQYNRLGIN